MKTLDGKRMALALLLLPLLAIMTAAIALSPKPALAAQQEERPLLMIVVGFEGEGGSAIPYNDEYDWNEALFSGEESLDAYFQEQSQGLFSLVPARETSAFQKRRNTNRADQANDGIVHVMLNSAHGAWGLVNEDPDAKKDFEQTVIDSFDAAQMFVDFNTYDEDGDGYITSNELIVIVCTSGYDASELSQADQLDLPLIWPHSGTIEEKTDGLISTKTLPSAYIAIAENFIREGDGPSRAKQEPIGIIAHEIGHCLGLPDLYALNDASEQGDWASYKAGDLSLMARGAWAQALNEQREWVFRPTSLDPWSLVKLDWCNPLVAEGESDYHLYSRESDTDYNVLLIPTANSNQYFLLENRQPQGWDAALRSTPSGSGSLGGIVIWHVDEGICEQFSKDGRVNDTDHRPGVMPVFFERDKAGAFSFNWATTSPDLEMPFYNITLINRSFGDADANIELPLYGSDDSAGAPARRTYSGISIQVLSASGDDMVVRVKQTGDAGQTSTLSSTRKPPLALIAILVIVCAIGAAAFALNESRRLSRRM